MKFVPALLLNLLVVGGGILLYDSLTRSDAASVHGPLEGDAAPASAPAGLTGSTGAKLAHSSEERIRGIESAIAGLQAEIERLRSGKGAAASEALDSLAPVQIDEKTLRWMTAYRRAILEREGEARMRARMAVEFERKGVTLPADQMAAVVRETMTFLDRARELARPPRDTSPEGQAEFERAARELRNEYELALTRIAPADQVERILETRMGRADKILPEDDG